MILHRASIFFFLVLAVAFVSCDAKNPYDTGPAYDVKGNLAKDSLLIVDYLETAEMDSLYRIYDPSGVVIIVQEEGTGSRPTSGNVIYTNYVGSLMSDGSVFDTNIKQVAIENELHEEGDEYKLLSFQLVTGNAIAGWHVGFSRLRPGSKAKFIIPSPYGYQDDPKRPKIPANSVLIFDVEFKGID